MVPIHHKACNNENTANMDMKDMGEHSFQSAPSKQMIHNNSGPSDFRSTLLRFMFNFWKKSASRCPMNEEALLAR